MCGIAGICAIDGQPLPEDAAAQVEAMCRRMRHRGPDGQGVWREGGVCLGHRRLSIIDLAGGAQPMHSADNRLHVTFNGEIYNFPELRQELEARGHNRAYLYTLAQLSRSRTAGEWKKHGARVSSCTSCQEILIHEKISKIICTLRGGNKKRQ